MNVVIVESPAKAKTINGYLGKDYEVLASFGHVRDLPAKDGSVDPEQDFAMLWEVGDKSTKHMSDIVRAVKASDKVILATDPDREGEAISWHVLEVLRARKVLKDKTGRARHLQRHHQIGGARGHAAPARTRPAAGRRLSGPARARLSRGVQPVSGAVAQAAGGAFGGPRAVGDAAARLRPRARDRGVPARGNTGRSSPICARPPTVAFEARLVGRRRPQDHPARHRHRARRPSAFRAALDAARYTVTSVEAKPVKRHPSRPSAPRRSSRTRRASSACRRPAPCRSPRSSTRASPSRARPPASSPTCGPTASTWRPRPSMGTRRVIGELHGDRYLPQAPRKYTVKAKNAQEAHEAIRPTDLSRLPRDMVRLPRTPSRQRLYELDLEAHRGEPDGIGRARAHHRRHPGRGRRPQGSSCAPPGRWCGSTAS